MEAWTNVGVPLIVALLTSTALWGVVSKVILKRMELTAKRSKADEAQRKMLVGLAHDRIIHLGMVYIERGCVTQDEYENLQVYLYEPYEEMGGNTYNTEHCSGLLLDYRRSESALRARPNMGISAEAQEQAEEVKRESYGIELGVIQDMYEAGDITRAQSKQLRRNVYVMSVDADAQI